MKRIIKKLAVGAAAVVAGIFLFMAITAPVEPVAQAADAMSIGSSTPYALLNGVTLAAGTATNVQKWVRVVANNVAFELTTCMSNAIAAGTSNVTVHAWPSLSKNTSVIPSGSGLKDFMFGATNMTLSTPFMLITNFNLPSAPWVYVDWVTNSTGIIATNISLWVNSQ